MDDRSIRRLARECGVPFGTVEKDYALTSLLSRIARFPKLGSMVFKGGTAIKKRTMKISGSPKIWTLAA